MSTTATYNTDSESAKLLAQALENVRRENVKLGERQQKETEEEEKAQGNGGLDLSQYGREAMKRMNQSPSTPVGGGESTLGSTMGGEALPGAVDMGWSTSGELLPGALEGAGGGGSGAVGGGASSGGMGAWGMGGIIGAAILGQHVLSNNTSREVEGVKTDDVFGGNFATEPWLAFLYDKIGLQEDGSPGEKFDAAIKNDDHSLALKRAPAALNYWGNPGGSVAYDVTEDVVGKKWAGVFDPIQWALNKLGD